MGTIVETADIDEALKVVADAYRELEPDCGRVYATVKLDIRKGEGRQDQPGKSNRSKGSWGKNRRPEKGDTLAYVASRILYFSTMWSGL